MKFQKVASIVSVVSSIIIVSWVFVQAYQLKKQKDQERKFEKKLEAEIKD